MSHLSSHLATLCFAHRCEVVAKVQVKFLLYMQLTHVCLVIIAYLTMPIWYAVRADVLGHDS